MAKPVAIPLTVTILLHLAVVLMLALNLTFSTPPPVVVQPQIIEAKLVSMEQLPVLRATPKPVTQAEPVPVDMPKPEAEKPEPIKPEPVKVEPLPKPEPLKTEPPKPDLEKQKLEKQKLLENEKAKAALLVEQKKEAEQKKAAEQKKQEDERKRKEAEDVQRKKQQEDAQRKQQEKNELAKAMAAEDNAMAAERDQEAVASYGGMIQRDVQNNWSRPPSARLGMHVVLLIQLIPSGDVINVSVLKSSGNDAFDQSAISAVRRVGKFAYLKELSDKSLATFDSKFRRLQLDFSPEDLRQ